MAKDKLIQKSVNLTELEWAIIEKMGGSSGAVIRNLLTDFMFLGQIKAMSKQITTAHDIYCGRVSRHKLPEWLKDVDFNSQDLNDLLCAYPSMHDLPDLYPDYFPEDYLMEKK